MMIRARKAITGLILFAGLRGGAAIAQQNPYAPTASEDPQAIDSAWQEASRPYDNARKEILAKVDRVLQAGPYRADWQSLRTYQVPGWYRDAKFGIFIHWGVYSVPAFGSEWYPRNMYVSDSEEHKHHLATYGPVDKFGYKDFVPLFRAERFDPAQWAQLFKEAGAKYVVPVFEHHDGFAMYDTGLSDWSAAKKGPRRDLMGDLVTALRAQGLHVGASSHRVEHNFFLGVGRSLSSDINDPQNAAFYGPAHIWLENKNHTPLSNDFTFVSSQWTADWLARSAEIVLKYKPEMIYFDWWIGQPSVRADLARSAAFYYDATLQGGSSVGVINYKDFAMDETSGVLDVERGQLSGIRALPWQTDTSVSNKSWGYIENDTFKSPEFIVHLLVDVVSKNGNLLLNVGPRSDGTIPEDVRKILLSVGDWLRQNGEAIYATRPWKVFGEGPTQVSAGAFHDTETQPYTAQDFRFTMKGDTLYAIELGWPSGGEAVIHELGAKSADAIQVRSVELLGLDSKLHFEQEADGLHIKVPEKAPGLFAYTFRVHLGR
jgi:alpha-L-fucosidase